MKSKATPEETNPVHKHTVKKLSGIISSRMIIKQIIKTIMQKVLSFDKNEVAFFNIKSHPFCFHYTISGNEWQWEKITKRLQVYYK